ncbi:MULTISPECIES: ribosome biogenesis GTP-binding protein YihA/YsxC [Congzhengia]|uniref:ribosome biogenesis GTP-binding protein YihA/YsxC n=1 Tax=Congzhengia TaxID=2944150 RepID=UPI0020160F9D|nr:ribosome biogenesis GTP-binding protein YihA/YsxC [Congzhengia minquanensis]
MKVNIHNARFLLSGVKKEHYPVSTMPEVAFAGRSNVGKSSMINKILNRKNFARVSATPGKTATINFYDIDKKLMLVDLPGYGYAAASKGERKALSDIINEYLTERKQLVQLILLVDSRHKPTEDDRRMMDTIKSAGGMAVVIATKTDKLSKRELEENLDRIIETLNLSDGDILLPFSTKTAESAENFWDYIYDYILFDLDDEEGE